MSRFEFTLEEIEELIFTIAGITNTLEEDVYDLENEHPRNDEDNSGDTHYKESEETDNTLVRYRAEIEVLEEIKRGLQELIDEIDENVGFTQEKFIFEEEIVKPELDKITRLVEKQSTYNGIVKENNWFDLWEATVLTMPANPTPEEIKRHNKIQSAYNYDRSKLDDLNDILHTGYRNIESLIDEINIDYKLYFSALEGDDLVDSIINSMDLEVGLEVSTFGEDIGIYEKGSVEGIEETLVGETYHGVGPGMFTSIMANLKLIKDCIYNLFHPEVWREILGEFFSGLAYLATHPGDVLDSIGSNIRTTIEENGWGYAIGYSLNEAFILAFLWELEVGEFVKVEEVADASRGINKLDDAIADAGKVGKVIENGHYVREGKPYGRPPYAKGQVEEVWENAKGADGKVRDPNTGEELFWNKDKPRNGQWDMGHLPDEKYYNKWKEYQQGNISKEEFVEWYKNPDNYVPESPSSNRGHKYE